MSALNVPIQLCSVCSTLGEFTPLWFRFENDEHMIETVKVEKVFSSREEKHCGMNYISYVCSCISGEKQYLFELRYGIASHRWKLFQLLS